MDVTLIALAVLQLCVNIRLAILGIRALTSEMKKEQVWTKKTMHMCTWIRGQLGGIFRKVKPSISVDWTVTAAITAIVVVVGIKVAPAFLVQYLILAVLNSVKSHIVEFSDYFFYFIIFFFFCANRMLKISCHRWRKSSWAVLVLISFKLNTWMHG